MHVTSLPEPQTSVLFTVPSAVFELQAILKKNVHVLMPNDLEHCKVKDTPSKFSY